MHVASRSLIQGVEVFRPDDSRGRLVAQHDEHRSFAPGEGAAGRAWEEGGPVIERDGGAAAVAIPAHRGDECRGVVLLHCDAGDGGRGAFEVWRRNDRGELSLESSLYMGLDRLARISPYVKFPRRAGLPGRVWEDRFPRVLGALQGSKQFIRVAAARSEQLASAIGVPFMRRPPELDAVLLVLNSVETPIAGAMEVWARDLETDRLRIVSADYGTHSGLPSASRNLSLGKGEGIAGRVFAEAAPQVSRDLLGVDFPRGQTFLDRGFEAGVGLPVFVGGDLIACVNLYL